MRAAPPVCVMCNDEPTWDAHHLMSRDYWRRLCFWDPRNGLGIGRVCHQNPARIKKWLKKNRPKQYRWLERQLKRIRTGPRPVPVDLKVIRRKLRKLL